MEPWRSKRLIQKEKEGGTVAARACMQLCVLTLNQMHSLRWCRSGWQGRKYRSCGMRFVCLFFSLSVSRCEAFFLKPVSAALHCPAAFREKNFHWINNALSCSLVFLKGTSVRYDYAVEKAHRKHCGMFY